MNLILPILAIVFAGTGLLWIFIPIFSGIPWVPTSEPRIRRALELAKLQPGEKLYDLGCGDGRVLIRAAREFGAVGIGIEISPLHCLVARLRVYEAGVADRVSIRWGNFFRANLAEADLVYQYGHSRFAERLGKQLQMHMRAGTRFVSINVDIPGWQPQALDIEYKIFLYEMPPIPGNLADLLMKEQP